MTRRTHRGIARTTRIVLALLAALALVLFADYATAATRTRRVVGQTQTETRSAPSKPRGKPGAASKAKPGKGRTAQDKKAPSQTKPPAKHSRRHRKQEDADDDSIVMYRAKHSATSRKAAPLATAHLAPPSSRAAKPTPKAASPTEKPKALEAKQDAAPADRKIASVDDFVRAAGGKVTGDDAAAEPLAENAAADTHPEIDEHITPHPAPAKTRPAVAVSIKPVAAPRPAKPSLAASAEVTPAPIERRTPQRIDGFGAEGDLLTRAPAATPTTRVVKTKKFEDTVPVTNDPELAALARPSREELADAAVQPQVLMKYGRNGRLLVPAPLKGSHEVLVHQNTMADDEGLDRIQDDEDLDRMRAKHLLVGFPDIDALRINPELPENRRAARPWTVKFAADMARAYYAKFHQPLTLSSAVRTVSYQLRLQRVNGNAAAVDGEGASPHLTGQAVDFGKHGMSIAQIAWMRTYLLPLMNSGKVDVEEEFQQACFHISVYKSYLPATKKKPLPRTEVAVVHAPRVDEAK